MHALNDTQLKGSYFQREHIVDKVFIKHGL